VPVAHDLWLVALSLLVAIQGSYVGLSLAVQFRGAVGARRKQLVAAAAISLAVAIWGMHFIGMLAVRLAFAVDYLVFPTLVSFLVCAIVVGAAVLAVGAGPLQAGRLAVAASFMGGGIASMHYIGMSALSVCAHLEHQPIVVAASVIIGVAASGLALWLANGRGSRPPLLLSATALGVAITGMHYTAMAGLLIFPIAEPQSSAPALSSDLLAIVVSIVAFVISGIFLLTLVPDRTAAASAGSARAVLVASDEAMVAGFTPAFAPAGAMLADRDVANANGNDDAGAVAHMLGTEPAAARAFEAASRFPVEHDGETHFLTAADIVAVRANAHYTYIFDGKLELFCPLAIGDVEAKLDPDRFVRVHRSHIVNIDRIVRFKRAGDNGVIELAGADRYRVPVSRRRLTFLKQRLGLKVA
jgi:NO-binding membrane sensor protein with MHYT domain